MRDLWRSDITGRNRTGTRLSELKSLFETGITVRAISEPLACCLQQEPSEAVQNILVERDFDVVGVKPAEASPANGYVRQPDLISGLCGDHRQDFGPDDLISDGTPLIDVLRALRDRPYCFVLQGRHVRSIVTRADLQKPPVRIMLFGFVTLLEMHMAYAIGRFYEGDSWQPSLAQNRFAAANKIMQLRIARNEKIDLLDCLQFCDRQKLVLGSPAASAWFGITNARATGRVLRGVEDLRNRLAHAQDLVNGTTWEATANVVAVAEELLETSEANLQAAVAIA